MKASVCIQRGVESLFGTRDENIRLIESGLSVHTQLVDNNLEIEGEAEERFARGKHPRRLCGLCAKGTSSITAT
jgi:phosphate starvation-inducible protein PhoH